MSLGSFHSPSLIQLSLSIKAMSTFTPWKMGNIGSLVAQLCNYNSSQVLCDKAAWTQKATLVISCSSASRNVLHPSIPSPQWSRRKVHKNLWIIWSWSLRCERLHLKLNWEGLRIKPVFMLSNLFIRCKGYPSYERWEEKGLGNFAKKNWWQIFRYWKDLLVATKVLF